MTRTSILHNLLYESGRIRLQVFQVNFGACAHNRYQAALSPFRPGYGANVETALPPFDIPYLPEYKSHP